MVHKILISSAGAGNAYASIVALRRSFNKIGQIVTADINPGHLITANLFSDKHYILTLASDGDNVRMLKEIIVDINSQLGDFSLGESLDEAISKQRLVKRIIELGK